MVKLYLFLLSQDINNGYDTYDSCVVCARNEDEARKIHPESKKPYLFDPYYHDWGDWDEFELWVDFEDIDKIEVKKIGVADANIKEGAVVCSSFNAG